MAGELLEAALAYAARGWQVVPVWGPKGKLCACGDLDCRDPAKHVRAKGGLAKATSDTNRIGAWWKGLPDSSIGIATGVVSGLWILSVDPEVGGKTLAALEAQFTAKLTKTLTAISGGGSRHYYYHNDTSLKLPSNALGPGVSILSDGKYVIAPPSKHTDGVYHWSAETPWGTPLSVIPEWIVGIQTAQNEEESRLAHVATKAIKGEHARDINVARDLYNMHNAKRTTSTWIPLPATPKACPICTGLKCFKAESETTWVCLSREHDSGGKKSGKFFYGDILDVDAFQHRRSTREHLEKEEYYGAAVRDEEFKKRQERLANVVPLALPGRPTHGVHAIAQTKLNPHEKPKEIGINKSFVGIVEILSTPGPKMAESVLDDRKLEYNELLNLHVYGRKRIQDDDISMFMLRTEVNHKDSDSHALTFSDSTMTRAVLLVARQNPYHPVKEYLAQLTWDGIQRLEDVPHDVLGAKDLPIHRSWFKKWMISAIARVRRPGCQVDHMLVLVNPNGGEGKSSFLRILGGDWYAESIIDVHDDRKASDLIQGIWIFEWSEMEALNRAREAGAANAFITRRVDHYLPPFGRFTMDVDRQAVFCGTTNDEDFLSARGGRRRFWPIRIGDAVDLDLARQHRDQWWAEADHWHREGVQWWPDDNDKADAEEVIDDAMKVDPIEDIIHEWLAQTKVAQHHPNGQITYVDVDRQIVTVQEILEQVVRLERGRWSRKEQNTIATILKGAGYEQVRGERDMNGKRPRIWKKV